MTKQTAQQIQQKVQQKAATYQGPAMNPWQEAAWINKIRTLGVAATLPEVAVTITISGPGYGYGLPRADGVRPIGALSYEFSGSLPEFPQHLLAWMSEGCIHAGEEVQYRGWFNAGMMVNGVPYYAMPPWQRIATLSGHTAPDRIPHVAILAAAVAAPEWAIEIAQRAFQELFGQPAPASAMDWLALR